MKGCTELTVAIDVPDFFILNDFYADFKNGDIFLLNYKKLFLIVNTFLRSKLFFLDKAAERWPNGISLFLGTGVRRLNNQAKPRQNNDTKMFRHRFDW